jgi:biotin carboxyl carrier protein
MKKLRVTVEGKAYEVLVELLDETESTRPPPPAARVSSAAVAAPTSAPRPAAAPAPAAGGGGGNDILSPLAGKVVSLDVAVGQVIAAGTQVATLEAMKMNTFIYAEKAGTVAALLVTPGAGVEEGAPLIRLG